MKVKIIRILLASIIGAIYSLTIFIPAQNIFISVLSKILCSIFIVLVAFECKSIKIFFRCYGAFFLSNFFFAGFMFAIWIFFKPNSMIYQNGSVYFDVNAVVLIVSSLICYGVSALISFVLKRRAPDSHIIKITISFDSKEISCPALLDTGNTLKEPFSSYPAIICEKKTIEKIIPNSIKQLMLSPSQYDSILDSNIRFISFKSIGGTGLLPAFKPDYVIANKGNESVKNKNVYIAVYNGSLSAGEYNALLGNYFFETSKKER